MLVDPQTATIAGRPRRLALSVDGLPVDAQIVGVIRRFPTIASDAAGFIVADQPTLSAALDAQAPGQGRPDELWVSSAHPAALRAALRGGPFAQLSASFRADAEQQFRSAPVARAVLGTLIGASALAGALAVVGLLVALLGTGRDERIERDLIAQGIGPRGVRNELRMRLMVAAVLGVVVGLATGVILTRLAVATVRAAGTVAVPRPPVVTVAPWAAARAVGIGRAGSARRRRLARDALACWEGSVVTTTAKLPSAASEAMRRARRWCSCRTSSAYTEPAKATPPRSKAQRCRSRAASCCACSVQAAPARARSFA